MRHDRFAYKSEFGNVFYDKQQKLGNRYKRIKKIASTIGTMMTNANCKSVKPANKIKLLIKIV